MNKKLSSQKLCDHLFSDSRFIWSLLYHLYLYRGLRENSLDGWNLRCESRFDSDRSNRWLLATARDKLGSAQNSRRLLSGAVSLLLGVGVVLLKFRKIWLKATSLMNGIFFFLLFQRPMNLKKIFNEKLNGIWSFWNIVSFSFLN